MIGIMLTAACYTVSSIEDKRITSKLKCTPAEFAFIVSSATMARIGAAMPFIGWGFVFSMHNCLILLALAAAKIIEFYTSAILLKTVSAYELKAWLGINIVCSYYYNAINGVYAWNPWVILFSILLFIGIAMIVSGQNVSRKERRYSRWVLCLLFLLFIGSKFLYGLMFGLMTHGCEATSVLFIVMLLTAFIQLSKIQIRDVTGRKGITGAVVSRIPNAAGLILEVFVAMQDVFLYAMIQPVQLAVLFLFSIVKKEPMGGRKLAGSILCLLSVCVITFLIFK